MGSRAPGERTGVGRSSEGEDRTQATARGGRLETPSRRGMMGLSPCLRLAEKGLRENVFGKVRAARIFPSY